VIFQVEAHLSNSGLAKSSGGDSFHETREPPTHRLCELLNSIIREVVIKQIDKLGITLSISVTKLKKESLARMLKEESPAPCAEMVEKWN
jgi:hypothetical protein